MVSDISYSSYTSEDLIFNHTFQHNENCYPSHTHDIYEMLFLKKGDVSYTVEGKTYQLSKNSLVISRPLHIHSVFMNCLTTYERYNILFDEHLLGSDILSYLPANIDVIHFDGNALILDIFKKMDYYCEIFEGEQLKKILTHLTEEIIYNITIASKNFENTDIYTVNPLINEAIAYINHNITLPLTVEAICSELHITKSYLHRLFVKHLKISPKKYILSKKLVMAQAGLRSGSKPTDVYLSYGFSDYSTFFRAYKEFFGYAPSDEVNTRIVRRIES